jgi:hypothetical protein
VDSRIYVFHGVRFQLQKWPFPALVHGKQAIPLDPLDDLSPVIDTSGSLYDPPALVNRASQPPTWRPSTSESPADSGPVEILAAEQSAYDEEGASEDEEELPPGQDPQIVD